MSENCQIKCQTKWCKYSKKLRCILPNIHIIDTTCVSMDLKKCKYIFKKDWRGQPFESDIIIKCSKCDLPQTIITERSFMWQHLARDLIINKR